MLANTDKRTWREWGSSLFLTSIPKIDPVSAIAMINGGLCNSGMWSSGEKLKMIAPRYGSKMSLNVPRIIVPRIPMRIAFVIDLLYL